MAVFDAIVAALGDEPGELWQRELALSLAVGMDTSPSASTAKELQALMVTLTGDRVAVKADVSDDLAAKRERRRAASS